ncbi:MAG: nuclear transport factor 2 family protein [Blastocatellia bacterium]
MNEITFTRPVAQAAISSGAAHLAKVQPNADDPAGFEGLIDRYFDSLNEVDENRRLSLIEQVWTKTGKFGTPYGEVQGYEGISELTKSVMTRFPNSRVRRTTKIDGFGNYLRFSFTLSEADGRPILSGVDFAIIENGKLQLVMGFFDFAPALK